MQIRDRVKELRRVSARELRPNPRNWREHPTRQRNALRGLLAEVGFAGAVLARELPDGSLELIDGHLRAETMSDGQVPVLVLDVDDAEAAKLLALIDPIGDLAEAQADAIQCLAASVETSNAAMRQVLQELRGEKPLEPPSGDQPAANRLIAEKFQVLVECRDEHEQRCIFERLSGEGLRCRALTL